ncbi:MAG: MotA/TolQ/ExbB proton channel family protein [Cocleimonas sp.]|nr:MotA/TolQ/ExbB proton channel family protein [Cocleimonas sp.]
MLDLASLLERALLITNAHSITNLFLLLIIGSFILSVVLARLGKGRGLVAYTPTLLTSLGILGTFIGIVIGLLAFDPKDIDGSITLLLSGLKTAFITSLAGMTFSILYKLLGTTFLFKENKITTKSKNIEPRDILEAITNQDQYLISLVDATEKQDQRVVLLIKTLMKQEQHLIALKKSISGEEESSLTGQFKLLRSDMNDNYKHQQQRFNLFSEELQKNLAEFSEMLSKSATEQVIEALKEVIVDFNHNLTEQFGDNFKALDESVKKLVTWQTQYSDQLSHMIVQYSEGVKAMTEIEASISHINHETQAIPETMANLKTVMEVNQHQIMELSRHLDAFKELKEQAVQAVPEMQAHVEKTMNDITSASQKANEGYQLLLENTENIQSSFAVSIENIQEKMQRATEALIKKQIEEMDRSFSALENEVTKSVDVTGKGINKQLEMIDASMTQEVNRVMTEMGGALGSISGQFTEDYKKLTAAMHNIVQARAKV